MRRVAFFLACLAPGGGLYACTQGTEPVAAPAADARQPAVQGLHVRLLEPGAAPRRVLRYRFEPPDELSLVITLDATSKATLNHLDPPAVRIPTLKLWMGLRFEPVPAEGGLRFSFRLAGGEVQASDELPVNLLDGLRADLAGLDGLAGSCVVGPRGLAREASAELPPGARPKLLKDQVEDLRQVLLRIPVPLPEEPVGPGARWEVRAAAAWEWLRVGSEVYAFHGEQTAIYRLNAMEGDRLQVQVELTRTFPAQEMMAANPVGSPGRLEALQTLGTGRLRVDLRTPLPEASLSLATHKRTSARLRPGGPARESTTDATLELTLRPQEAPGGSAAAPAGGQQ